MLGLGLNINKYNTGLSPNLLLDKFPDAAAAYSLRALSKNWVAQPVVRVRRDIDDTERDFTAKEVADGTMESWVNWYDETLPADHGSGAAAAYSLREVSAAWAGQPVVRVRRESDDAEADFTAAEVEDGTMLNWVFGVTDETLPADHGSGAAAAYSLRYVAAAYEAAGSPVVRVRRSSNNSEMDFTPTQIEDGTLVTWVGVGNDGFVTTWYDQSGNERNSIQVNAGQQPEIVRTGSLVSVGKKRGVYFDLGQRIVNNFPLETPISVFSTVEKTTSGIITRMIHGGSEGIFYLYWNTTTEIAVTAGGQYTIGSNDWIGTRIYSLHAVSGDNQIFINSESAVISSDIGSKTPNGLVIGDIRLKNNPVAGNYNWQDGIAEVIIYSEDARAYGSAIESNTNRYYGIYDANAYVVKWYDQSGNGRDAEQATLLRQPNIVKDGQVVTVNGKPAIDYDGIDDSLRVAFSTLAGDDYLFFSLAKLQPLTRGNYFIGGINEGYVVYVDASNIYIGENGVGYYFNSSLPFTWVAYQNANFIKAEKDGNTWRLKAQGVETSGALITPEARFFPLGSIGAYFSNRHYEGDVSELILYDTNQSDNVVNIETNTRQYYNVYQQNGYVVKWYDQSGNGLDLVQTTVSLQAKIVDSGSVVKNELYQNSVLFDRKAMVASLALNQPFTVFLVGSQLDITPFYTGFFGGGVQNRIAFKSAVSTWYLFNGIGLSSPRNIELNASFLAYIEFSGPNSKIGFDSDTLTVGDTGISSNSISFTLGSSGNPAVEQTYSLINEVVIYEESKVGERAEIETNINNHYNIY